MGMDVMGKSPINEQGEYFRANIWSWHPIWEYCCELAPEITEPVENAHSNDGDGLDAENSVKLGELILTAISDGSVKEYLSQRETALNALPDVKCYPCRTTGKREWLFHTLTKQHRPKWDYDIMTIAQAEFSDTEPEVEYTENARDLDEVEEQKECNSCGGKGSKRPFITSYNFAEDHLEEFGHFLKSCGGFEIW